MQPAPNRSPLDGPPNSVWPWLAAAPLVLASGSATRRALLHAAGIATDVIKPAVDERHIESPLRAMGYGPADRALMLARAKTLDVAGKNRSRIVMGADQTLDAHGHPGTKARTRQEAADDLAQLSGRTHRLHSAFCIAIAGMPVYEAVVSATLHARAYNHQFISDYCAAAGDALLQSVGCYQLEGLGQHLFARIEGDHSTILGLPMQPVLDFFRRRGLIAA